jgi:hypothetical protein
MSTQILAGQVEAAAKAAGLAVVSNAIGADFNGKPTRQFTLELANAAEKTQKLEISESFDFGGPELKKVLEEYLAEVAKRLKNPRPDVFLTLHGMPLSFAKYAWPFHLSTSGADSYVVHGEVKLEDGKDSPLHAKIAAALTVTFAEVLPALEQPFAEGFVYNAVRKTMDQGQLELVKSGNRQPVPVTTRYYSRWSKKFTFNDTTETQRQEFLAAKVYWCSGVLGGGAPVWLLDPRDAQYLNTTVAELRTSAVGLAREGVIQLEGSWIKEGAADGEYATPTAALMGHAAKYEEELEKSLAFSKPSFNEEMRAGHTNM